MPALVKFAALSDVEAGALMGFGNGRKAANRGRSAKVVAKEISALPVGQLLELHDERSGTEKEVLDALFTIFPDLITATEGYLPRTDAVIAIITHRLGHGVTSSNLAQANECCSTLVREVMGPKLRRFIRETLGNESGFVPLNEGELVEFLTGPYAQFAKSASSSLVSRAGSLNEGLVREALKAANVPATKTGGEGNADVQILAGSTNPPQTLNVEIKSYGARERLLRGLHDCNPPKVGVGFFNRASEFNGGRTTLLLGTKASAIYLPEATFDALEDTTRERQNAQGGLFYRPLAMFGADMAEFSRVGVKAFGAI